MSSTQFCCPRAFRPKDYPIWGSYGHRLLDLCKTIHDNTGYITAGLPNSKDDAGQIRNPTWQPAPLNIKTWAGHMVKLHRWAACVVGLYTKIFQKSRSHQKILGAIRVIWNNFCFVFDRGHPVVLIIKLEVHIYILFRSEHNNIFRIYNVYYL